MQNYLLAILIVILAPIVIEDFRHRQISLAWILGVLLIAIFQQLNTDLSSLNIATNTIINLGIILLNYVILTLYFSIRNRKIINIKNEYLGIGDIAFLLSAAFLFSPINFICFLLCSLIFTLVFTLFTRLFFPNKLSTIPLAGLQAFFLAIILLVMFFNYKNWKTNNDEFTLSMIFNYAGIS
jgi:hypothetical protein